MSKRPSAELKTIINRKAELSAHIKKLQTEYAELEVAERVLLRLAGERTLPQKEEQNANIITETDAPPTTDMTVGEMALSILGSYDLAEDVGLTSREILDEIRKRWMPRLQRTSLTAPLYRLKNAGKIVRVGRRWELCKEQKNGDQQ